MSGLTEKAKGTFALGLQIKGKVQNIVERHMSEGEEIAENQEASAPVDLLLLKQLPGQEDKDFVRIYVDYYIDERVKQLPIRLIRLIDDKKGELIEGRVLADELKANKDQYAAKLLPIDKKFWASTMEAEIGPGLAWAIFSHRWASGEPDFDTTSKQFGTWWENPSALEGVAEQEGVSNLLKFCATALRAGFHLVWSDTCCINKTIHSELQESINSMFKWYRTSNMCIVHMAGTTKREDAMSAKRWTDVWFTRVWTLQELICPAIMKFYLRDWSELVEGSKNDKDNEELVRKLSEASGIDVTHIKHFDPTLSTPTIRDRMIWASGREATKEEDVAYSLMGICNVGMDVRYGEGREEAFYRLQEQIIKGCRDPTLFHWCGEPTKRCSMLAAHPVYFQHKDDCLDRLQPYFPYQRSLLTKLFLACTCITCCNACISQSFSCAVRVEVLIDAGEVINKAESHFDVTNNGLQLKVETTRVLHKYPLPRKEGNHRAYLYLAGYQRVKVAYSDAMKREIAQKKSGNEWMIAALGDERKVKDGPDRSQGERLPRIGVLLYKVGKNTWERIRTKEPIILKRTNLQLVSEELLHTVYIR